LIKIAIAGTQEFIERCRAQAAENAGLTVVNAAAEPHEAVAVLEWDIDALLVGFDGDRSRLVLESACRKEVRAARFVSVPDYRDQLRWMQLRATCLIEGKEIEGIAGYYRLQPGKPQRPQNAHTAEEDRRLAVKRIEKVRESARKESSVSHRNKIVTFLSRGGQGQSTMIAALAQSIAERSGLSVCIVDLDYSAPPGDVARLFAFRESSHPALAAWPDTGGKNIATREQVLKRVIGLSAGVFLLPAASREGGRGRIDEVLLKEALYTLYRYFPLVVVDASLNLEREAAAAAQLSDEAFWCSSPDLKSVEGLKIYSDRFVREYGLDKARMSLIVARALPQSSYRAPDLAAYVGLPCGHSFQEDTGVRLLLDNERPLDHGRLPRAYRAEIEKLSHSIFPVEVYEKRKSPFWRLLFRERR
jgi:Flp pilus assembly CpaE family ATPase